jgi:hypothetical protein
MGYQSRGIYKLVAVFDRKNSGSNKDQCAGNEPGKNFLAKCHFNDNLVGRCNKWVCNLFFRLANDKDK